MSTINKTPETYVHKQQTTTENNVSKQDPLHDAASEVANSLQRAAITAMRDESGQLSEAGIKALDGYLANRNQSQLSSPLSTGKEADAYYQALDKLDASPHAKADLDTAAKEISSAFLSDDNRIDAAEMQAFNKDMDKAEAAAGSSAAAPQGMEDLLAKIEELVKLVEELIQSIGQQQGTQGTEKGAGATDPKAAGAQGAKAPTGAEDPKAAGETQKTAGGEDAAKPNDALAQIEELLKQLQELLNQAMGQKGAGEAGAEKQGTSSKGSPTKTSSVDAGAAPGAAPQSAAAPVAGGEESKGAGQNGDPQDPTQLLQELLDIVKDLKDMLTSATQGQGSTVKKPEENVTFVN